MTETADGGELSAQEALSTIEEATGYEEPLRRRTEGAVWMIWGFVTAGIQLSFSAAQDLFRVPGAHGETVAPAWFEPLVLFGWPLVGLAATYAVWRIASLQRPSLEGKGWRSLLGGALWLPLLYAAWGLIFLLGPGLPEALYPVVSIGAAWLALGAIDVFQATPTGRRSLLAIGTIILAAGLIAAFVMEPSVSRTGRLTYGETAPLVILVGGGAPFLIGFYQALRG